MKQKIDLVTAAMALGIAGYLAAILECLARNEIGWSTLQIGRSAVLGAVAIALGVGAASLRKTTSPRESDPSAKR